MLVVDTEHVSIDGEAPADEPVDVCRLGYELEWVFESRGDIHRPIAIETPGVDDEQAALLVCQHVAVVEVSMEKVRLDMVRDELVQHAFGGEAGFAHGRDLGAVLVHPEHDRQAGPRCGRSLGAGHGTVGAPVEPLKRFGQRFERPQPQCPGVLDRPSVGADHLGHRLGGGIVVPLGHLIQGGAGQSPFEQERPIPGILLHDADRDWSAETEAEQLAFGALYVWIVRGLDLEDAGTAVRKGDWNHEAVREWELAIDRQFPTLEVGGDELGQPIQPGLPGAGKPLSVSLRKCELVNPSHPHHIDQICGSSVAALNPKRATVRRVTETSDEAATTWEGHDAPEAQFGPHRFSAGDGGGTSQFRGARFDVADLRGARFTDCDLTGVTIRDGWLVDVDISGYLRNFVVNGVDVSGLVNAELDRRNPVRVQFRAGQSADDVRAIWAAIEGLWADALERAGRLGAPALGRRVKQEWSFEETLRHLIFITDAWASRTVLDEPTPYHRIGLPQSWYPPQDAEALGIDLAAQPDYEEILVVRADRMAVMRSIVDGLADYDLGRRCHRSPAPGYPEEERSVIECISVVMDEEIEHHRFAVRDLELLEAGAR